MTQDCQVQIYIFYTVGQPLDLAFGCWKNILTTITCSVDLQRILPKTKHSTRNSTLLVNEVTQEHGRVSENAQITHLYMLYMSL